MRRSKLLFLFVVLLSMASNKSFAYDIAVENADGVTIYYEYYIDDNNELVVVGASTTEKLVIPEEVTYMNRSRKVVWIKEKAFYGRTDLKSVIIPNSVKYIRWKAFNGCTGLTSVTIPNSVIEIQDHAFQNCRRLTSITIPNSVKSVDTGCFEGCTKLYSVTIGNNVSELGHDAFLGCSALTAVHISDLSAWCKIWCGNFSGNPLSYAHHLYLNNNEVTNLIIPDGTEQIGKYSFYGCTGLTSVTIPNSVSSIGYGAFDGDDIPTVISLIENPINIEGKSSSYRAFSTNTFNNATLYVPKGTINKYKATEGWKDFLYIKEGTGPNGGGGETPKKCSTPTISYQNGKLIFSCDTEGATYQYSITDNDIKSGSSNEIKLGLTYNISVYASKTGYEDSETATATLCWIDTEPKTEGITNVAQVRARAVMIQSNGNVLSVSGADEGTEINVYDTAGKKVGSSIATSDIMNITTSLDSGSIAIIKIGEKAVKVLIK